MIKLFLVFGSDSSRFKYTISNNTASWFEAEFMCDFGQLLYYTTVEEISYIKNNIINGTNETLWIGLHSLENEGQWIWSDSKIACFFNKWAEGEPRYTWRGCGAIDKDNLLYSNNCSERKRYICKQGKEFYFFICFLYIPNVIFHKKRNQYKASFQIRNSLSYHFTLLSNLLATLCRVMLAEFQYNIFSFKLIKKKTSG